MADKPKSSLFLRVVSALILMPVVLFALIYGQWPFLALIIVAAIISLKEWVGMAKLAPKPVAHAVAGILYIAVCFAAFVWLRLRVEGGVGMAICMLLCVWATDSGAYFSGKTIGGPKMAPLISPNKTWAGLIGGILSSIAAFFLYAHVIGPYLGSLIQSDYILPPALMNPFVIVAFGLAIAIAGQIGDLLISKEKRIVGVKDTGHLIPGHGGILDRIDSVLLVAFVFLIGVKVLGL